MMNRKSIGMLKLLRGQKISTKLLFWFIFISIVPLSIIAFIVSSNLKNTLEEHELRHFYQIAENKNKQIENYFQDQEKDFDAISHSPIITEVLEDFESVIKESGPESEQYIETEKKFNEYLNFIVSTFGFYDLFLINSEGDIVYTVKREADFNTNLINGEYKYTELALAYIKSTETGNIEISKYTFYSPSNKPASFLVAPINKKNLRIGSIAVQLKIEDIFELMQDYSKLGETGEVLIGQMMDKESFFINPLRFV
ncbi:MAG: cache domain-containing protein, partial [Bacteroidia bacterium]|nr:cache domain-containing protein [Bacteroidia bacterium]